MELPPSSYHDSLEELWDEEEEPEEVETVMKVVPSVYHQYLDVFSKVKAEKLPPHRPCDPHIELEGSLPPVGVIYSLSNQESDPLRAYISKNVEKCFIWTSSSSTGAPVLIVKKKDGGFHFQFSDSGKHPIAFNSCKLISADLNYEIHQKELPGIVCALKRWRAFFLSLSLYFEALTNHSSLKYFMYSKVLTRRQALWAAFLSEFPFSITYRPGHLATLPDALSHWDNIDLDRGEDFISNNPIKFQQLIKQDEVQPSRYFLVKVESFLNSIYSIENALWQTLSTEVLLKNWVKVVVSNDPTIQPRILQKHHYSPLAGHPGQEKTLKLIKQDFHWSGMTQFIKDYVSSCQQCSRNKNIHHKKFGLLKPLPIPKGPWICLSMDFIT
ncbi:hypothetical protein O181_070018 [Austropuccinia psidii MF-1]|uniref:Integrase zinc-binding domain-containing protein n=1 Tax=Austropuccinia psidii MF-1 TaxID=1389203 RepID=A0A9Q3I6W2_9BASI|nr:hypothetical protein [Austropuccinia psidii MF-1]